MAGKQHREILRRAERARYDAMTDEELKVAVAQSPPDPAMDAALPLLSDAELELALDGLLSRARILALAKGRTHAPGYPRPPV